MAEYIEREAVLQAVCVGCDGEGICDAPALCRIRAWVSAIPAADVVPVRHGRWVKQCERDFYFMECSACEKYWIPEGDNYDFRYCPGCGALMDGKDGDGNV